jgi:hypothetical protein
MKWKDLVSSAETDAEARFMNWPRDTDPKANVGPPTTAKPAPAPARSHSEPPAPRRGLSRKFLTL